MTYFDRKNPLLYEINTRLWLKELAQKYGQIINFSNIPNEEWEALKNLGINSVWLMGIWQTSPQALFLAQTNPDIKKECSLVLGRPAHNEDIQASPYSIYNYNVNPELGDWESLAKLKTELNKQEISLILDFVPNHLAIDHHWVNEHPEYFVTAPKEILEKTTKDIFENNGKWFAHGRDPYFPGWTDTVQLNYFSLGTRKIMTDILVNISEYCDGVRCDMAMLELNDIHEKVWGGVLASQGYIKPEKEFWQEAIQTAKKKNSKFCLIAEAYWGTDQHLKELGFDFIYDKTLYDGLLQNDFQGVQQHVKKDDTQDGFVRFIENHDEPRAMSAFGLEKNQSAAIISLTLPGIRLIHHGQLQGLTKRYPVQLATFPKEQSNPQIEKFYNKLLLILIDKFKENLSYHSIRVSANTSFNQVTELLASHWADDKKSLLVVTNMSSQTHDGKIFLSDLPRDTTLHFKDLLNDVTYTYESNDILQNGLYIRLDGYKSHILSFSI